MVHGTPDWGLKKKSTVYALDDMAELAARLGSIVTFDRRGDVILLDDFEDGVLRWGTLISDSGTFAVSTDTARNGGNSGKITTSATTADFTEIRKFIAFPQLSIFGVEFSFSFAAAGSYRLNISAILYDGAQYQNFQLYFDFSNNTWYYADASAAWVALSPTTPLYASTKCFHTAKLVLDGVNKKYVRLIVDDQTYLLADIAVSTPASTINPVFIPSIRLTNLDDVARTVYVDDFIVTQNEPT